MRAHTTWLVAIVALAAILDLCCLGCAPLTQNESISYAVATSNRSDFVDLAFGDKPETALYYLILRGWTALGTSEFALRMLSVIFAVASIPLLYTLAARLFEQRTALVAALLLAVNSSFMMQAQNARSYSLSTFLVLLATLFLVDSNQKPSRLKSILYVVAMACAIYSHTLSILIVPAHALWILATDSSHGVRLRFAMQMIALAVLLIPAALLTTSGEPDQFDWIPQLSTLSFKDLLSGFVGAPYGPSNALRRSCMAFYATAFAFGAVAVARSWSEPRARFGASMMALAGFLIPTILLLAVSTVHPLYQFRYLTMALPFFALFTAAGLCATAYRMASSIVLTAIVILSIFIQFSIHRLPSEYPWPRLTRTLLEQAQPGDSLIILPAFLRFPIDYCAARFKARGRLPTIAYPDWDSRLRVNDHYVESFPMRGDNPPLRNAIGQNYPRLWIVLPSLGTPTSAEQLQSLSVRYKCHSSERFAELALMRFDNCGAAGANQ